MRIALSKTRALTRILYNYGNSDQNCPISHSSNLTIPVLFVTLESTFFYTIDIYNHWLYNTGMANIVHNHLRVYGQTAVIEEMLSFMQSEQHPFDFDRLDFPYTPKYPSNRTRMIFGELFEMEVSENFASIDFVTAWTGFTLNTEKLSYLFPSLVFALSYNASEFNGYVVFINVERISNQLQILV